MITPRKFQAKISPFDQNFEKQEEEMVDLKLNHHYELRKFSSGPIQNEMITINYEHPYSEDKFERIFQDKISPSDQSLRNNNKN